MFYALGVTILTRQSESQRQAGAAFDVQRRRQQGNAIKQYTVCNLLVVAVGIETGDVDVSE